MPVNQQNVAVVTQFNKVPARYFQSAAGVCPGAASFLAAALCRINPGGVALVDGLMGNYDAVNDLGWLLQASDLGDTGVRLTVTVGEGAVAGSESFAADVGPHVFSKLMLVHLGVTDATDELRIYVNGGLVSTNAVASPVLASALTFGIGDNGDGGTPALGTEIAGVAYGEFALTAAQMDATVGAHLDACYRAYNMSFFAQSARLGGTWTNRWDVREGCVLLGAAGTLDVDGQLTVLPATPDTWTPSDGADELTRLGGPPTSDPATRGVGGNVITNPVWANTPIIVGVVPAPQA